MSLTSAQKRLSGVWHLRALGQRHAARAVVGAVRRSAVLNTRHSVRSVLHLSAVVCEVARGFSGGQEFPTSINVANEDSVTGVQHKAKAKGAACNTRALPARTTSCVANLDFDATWLRREPRLRRNHPVLYVLHMKKASLLAL